MSRRHLPGKAPSAGPSRRNKRGFEQAKKRAMKKRAASVNRLNEWIRKNPTAPLAMRLKAARAGIEVVSAEDMVGPPPEPKIESGERRTKSGIILPAGVKHD